MADLIKGDAYPVELDAVPENEKATTTSDVKVITENGKATGDYVIQNPKSTGCKTALSGGMTLEMWDIENEQFYANEGKTIMTRNLWASIPNLLLGFAVWLMWSVTVARIQLAHEADPSAYYFKDFAGEYQGVSEGFRGCPGWYDTACCATWMNAPQADFDSWMATQSFSYTNADEFTRSLDFKNLGNVVTNSSLPQGFDALPKARCVVNPERRLAYKALLYVIPAAAGLAGGVFRLPNSFVVPTVGGRNVVYFTSILLAVPCAWMAIALASPDTPYLQVTIAAMFSGVGGGSFASSMNNISPFFPKRQQGYGLGMNGGLGNLGVSLCQFVLPVLFAASPNVGGYSISYGGWFLCPLCLLGSLVAFLWMNNMPKFYHAVPDNFFQMFFRYISLQGPAYIASLCGIIVLYATRSASAFDHWVMKLVRIIVLILIVCIIEHAFIWFLAPGPTKESLRKQVVVFKNKHTYVMTYLYIMTFGSFIGFSNAFPKLILDLFDEYGTDDCVVAMAAGAEDCTNPDAPGRQFSPAFLGAMIGSLIRPVGGMMSDKYGGARVTHYHTLLLTVTTVVLGFICMAVRNAKSGRTNYYPPFFICFMVIFYCTGVGNGSTFRQIGVIFDKAQAPPVLGWSSAIASFGAFLIPQFFGVFIAKRAPEIAFFIFAGYYATCLVVNWWYYFRKGAEKPC